MPEHRPLNAVALYKPEIQLSAFKNKPKETSAATKEKETLPQTSKTNLNLSRASEKHRYLRFGSELTTKVKWGFFVLWGCHLLVIFVSFWWSLGFHITVGHMGKPLWQEPSVSTYSFFPGFFPPLLKGETLSSDVPFPGFCQRQGAGYNFSTRKEEVDACLVHVYTFKPYASQPRPHAFYCLHVYSHHCMWHNGPGQGHPSWSSTETKLGLHPRSPGGCQSRQQHDPAPDTELCTFPSAADGSTGCQKRSRAQATVWSLCFRLLFIHNMGIHSLPPNQVWGKKSARTFHLQVSCNNNLLKKDFEM